MSLVGGYSCSNEGMLKRTHSGLAASYGSPFPKLTSPGLPGGFLWHTDPWVSWCVGHVTIRKHSTWFMLCCWESHYQLHHLIHYQQFPLKYRTRIKKKITWKWILVWSLDLSLCDSMKHWVNNKIGDQSCCDDHDNLRSSSPVWSTLKAEILMCSSLITILAFSLKKIICNDAWLPALESDYCISYCSFNCFTHSLELNSCWLILKG